MNNNIAQGHHSTVSECVSENWKRQNVCAALLTPRRRSAHLQLIINPCHLYLDISFVSCKIAEHITSNKISFITVQRDEIFTRSCFRNKKVTETKCFVPKHIHHAVNPVMIDNESYVASSSTLWTLTTLTLP